jgi:hypothetical protein
MVKYIHKVKYIVTQVNKSRKWNKPVKGIKVKLVIGVKQPGRNMCEQVIQEGVAN